MLGLNSTVPLWWGFGRQNMLRVTHRLRIVNLGSRRVTPTDGVWEDKTGINHSQTCIKAVLFNIFYCWILPNVTVTSFQIKQQLHSLLKLGVIADNGGLSCGYLNTGGIWVQRRTGHTAVPLPLGDTGTGPTLGCRCYHTSLLWNTGRLRNRQMLNNLRFY